MMIDKRLEEIRKLRQNGDFAIYGQGLLPTDDVDFLIDLVDTLRMAEKEIGYKNCCAHDRSLYYDTVSFCRLCAQVITRTELDTLRAEAKAVRGKAYEEARQDILTKIHALMM